MTTAVMMIIAMVAIATVTVIARVMLITIVIVRSVELALQELMIVSVSLEVVVRFDAWQV